MDKEISVHGDLDSIRDGLKLLGEHVFIVRQYRTRLFSDVNVSLSYRGTGYHGKVSVEKVISRLCLQARKEGDINGY